MFPLLIFPALCARTTTSLHSSKGGLRTRVDSSFYVSSILDPVPQCDRFIFRHDSEGWGHLYSENSDAPRRSGSVRFSLHAAAATLSKMLAAFAASATPKISRGVLVMTSTPE